jgi:methyl-accepting chemotaxis protein
MLTIVIQKLSVAARATFGAPPLVVERASPHIDPPETGHAAKAPGNLARAITPFADDIQRIVGELAEYSAALHASRADMVVLSDLYTPDAVRSVTEHNPVTAAELRSTSALVSGAAHSVESSIAAASLELLELAEAIGAVAQSDPGAADLLARVEQLTQHIQAAASRLAQSIRQIDEIAAFIDKVALQPNVKALGKAVNAARAADEGQSLRLVASGVRALVMQTEERSARVHACSVGIVDAAHRARAAMVHANDVILAFNAPVRAIGNEAEARGLNLPGIPHRMAASRSVPR